MFNTFLNTDALREKSGPGRKGHSEGWKLIFKHTSQKRCAEGGKRPWSKRTTLRDGNLFLNTVLKKDALREERDPGRKGHSEGGKRFFKYTSQKCCAEGGKRPRSKKTL